MDKLQKALSDIRLDESGKVVMSDELLDMVCEHDGMVSAGSNGGDCESGRNISCTNSSSCNESSNGWCTNSDQCGGTSNGACRTDTVNQ